MNKQNLINLSKEFINNSRLNVITEKVAISDNVIGMKIYEFPLIGIGNADDNYFNLFKEDSVIGQHFMPPKKWLRQSKTVISLFLPFTDTVKIGNSKDIKWPSEEWLHARVEGEHFMKKLLAYLESELIKKGCNSTAPLLDKRYWTKTKASNQNSLSFTSNWSERHAAFVCGLGTFGLS